MKSSAIFCFLLGVAMVLASPVDIDIPLGKRSAEMLRNGRDNFESLSQREQIGFVNDFVDMAMEEVKQVMTEQKLDPMDVPDLYKKISYKLIIITYWGDLNLTRGSLDGISTIHRHGDVALDYTGRLLTLTVPISFDTFHFDYHYKVKIMSLGPSGGVDGRAKDIRLTFTIEIDFLNLHLKLKKFDIQNIGQISVHLDGNILIDWLINLVTGVVTTLFRGLITWVLEKVVKTVLESGIDQINDILAGLFPAEFVMPSLTAFDYSFLYQ